jgi:hypothetical protein
MSHFENVTFSTNIKVRAMESGAAASVALTGSHGRLWKAMEGYQDL